MKRPRYGSGPMHVVVHVTAFTIAGYALAQIISGGRAVNFIAWFGGAAIVHDLVALPLYSLLDRLSHGALRARKTPRVPAINHLRVPALISGLLLLVYFPLILGLSDRRYFAATGHHLHGYTRNWLGITAAMFAGSAVLYAIRVRRATG